MVVSHIVKVITVGVRHSIVRWTTLVLVVLEEDVSWC